jgi:hypothetical protein
VRRDNPRDVVTVFIPEYVVGRWWEQILHNQSALRLKGRLLFQPGVMVTSVPWQLASSDKTRARVLRKAGRLPSSPGSVRRGFQPRRPVVEKPPPPPPDAAAPPVAPKTDQQVDQQP